MGVGRRTGGAEHPSAGEVRALRPLQPKAAEVLEDNETGSNPASGTRQGTGSAIRSVNRTTAGMLAIADSLPHRPETLEHSSNRVQTPIDRQCLRVQFGVVCMPTVCASNVVRHLLVCVAAQLMACASIANEAEIVGVAVVKNWTVYQSKTGDLECGIIARPTESINTKDGKLAVVKRGDILLAVTIDPSSTSSRYLVSFQSGYPFKKASTVTMRIDNRTFTFEIGQTEADSEWAWPPADDDVIVEAMKRGINAVLTAVSRRNTDTKDTFSLLGVTDALQIAEERCSTQS